jgi:hypothetical protein
MPGGLTNAVQTRVLCDVLSAFDKKVAWQCDSYPLPARCFERATFMPLRAGHVASHLCSKHQGQLPTCRETQSTTRLPFLPH